MAETSNSDLPTKYKTFITDVFLAGFRNSTLCPTCVRNVKVRIAKHEHFSTDISVNWRR